MTAFAASEARRPTLRAAGLRRDAQEQAARFPPLLAEAAHLAQALAPGTHGRRRAGQGDEFWQFRAAHPGDAWRAIDWRRSARSDTHFIREREWQAAQSVLLWIDGAQSMTVPVAGVHPDKASRAIVLGLALSILLLSGGERVGLVDGEGPARAGNRQIDRIAAALAARGDGPEYGSVPSRPFPAGSRAVFLSDFLGPWEPLAAALARAAESRAKGALVQILDTDEARFPYDGRTRFHSPSGRVRFETLRARGLKGEYLGRMVERRARLEALCARTGWRFCRHVVSEPAAPVLAWLYGALEKRR